MHKTNPRFALIPLAVALGFSGCQNLGPDAAKKTRLPANLAIDSDKGSGSRPLQSEPLAAEPARPPEYYPATGKLLGSDSGSSSGAAGKRSTPKAGKYTLNFDDADLSEVAKTILDEALKINYILSPKVTGKVTLQTTRPLAEDELIPTLEMLLRMNGAVLIRDGSLYRIEPDATAVADAPGARLGVPGQALPPGYQLRVVPLRYVGVKEMQKVLEPLMPPKSIVRVDETRNILVLGGSGEELEGVLETLRLFDVDFMRGMSVAIFPLKNVEPALIAEELDKILGDTNKGPLAGLIRLLPIERLNAILAVSPQPRYLDQVETWVERLDRYTTKRAGGVHVYRVQNVDALELANTLSNVFGGGTGARGSRPSLSPGSQGTQIGAAGGFGGVGDGSGFGTSGGTGFGSSGSGFGDSFGSDMGGSNLGTSGGTLGGSSFGTSGTGGFGSATSRSSSSRSGGGSGGGLSGSFGGGIGRGTSTTRSRGSAAVDLGIARIVADPANNALIITAKAQDYKEIEAVIKELDIVPLQVLIDATIAEITLKDDLQYGLQWYFQQGSNAEGLGGIPGRNVLENVAAGLQGYAFSYSLVALGKDLRVVLSALAAKNKVNVLSSPSVMVLNNQEAQINVGNRVPIPTSSAANINTGTTTPFVTSTLQLQESGITLKVKPRVNAGGLVTLDIAQEVSTPTPVRVANTDAFQFAQRKILSSVAVNNGDTLALGGLIDEKTTNTRSGIPLLYDLPLLGDLFGTTVKAIERTELVVLLTPRVVESRAKAKDITNEFRRKLTGLYEGPPMKSEEAPAPRD